MKKFSKNNYRVKSIALLLISLFNHSISMVGQDLYPIKDKSDKWGFINTTGKIVITVQYDCVFNFTEGMASVKIGNKWGFIDTTGNAVIPIKYDSAFSFSCGLALVFNDSFCGYIDHNGIYKIEPKYYDGARFSEDRAFVKYSQDCWGFINKKDKFIRKDIRNYSPYDHPYDFEAFAGYPRFNAGTAEYKYKIINTKGRIVSYYTHAYNVPVIVFPKETRVGYVLNKDTIIKPRYLSGSLFLNNDHAWVIDSIGSNYILKMIDISDSALFSIVLDSLKYKQRLLFNYGMKSCWLWIYDMVDNKKDYTMIVKSNGKKLIIKEGQLVYNWDCYDGNNLHSFVFPGSYGDIFNDNLFLIKLGNHFRYVDIDNNIVWESDE